MTTSTRAASASLKRSSNNRHFLRAVFLSALLMPLASVAHADPTTLTCGFGDAFGGGDIVIDNGPSCFALDDEGAQTNRFSWGAYFIDLTLHDPDGDFEISITDHPMSQSDFKNRIGFQEDLLIADVSSSYKCIPVVDPSSDSSPCRDFEIEASGGDWEHFGLKIAWLYDSENNGYPGGNGRARILHNFGGFGSFFDEDMCLVAQSNPNYDPCEYSADLSGDPFIFSGNTDFSTFTPALAPEPTLLLLLGAGGAAAIYRRRQR